MSGERWIVENTNETLQELNESYRILTERCVQEHDGKPEQVWIADVYEWSDAAHIVELHNAALENKEENGSSHNSVRDAISRWCERYYLDKTMAYSLRRSIFAALGWKLRP